MSPDATKTFTLIVDEAPAVTSVTSATFTVGTFGSFRFTSSGFPPPTFSETGALPNGVTLDSTTGVLSGTPAAGTGGVYPITIDVENGVSDPTQSFSLTVDQAAAITSAASGTLTVGTHGSLTVTDTGFPTPTLTEGGALPAGISFDPARGTLSGTPAAGTAGTYHLSFTAHNGVGSNATQAYTLTVTATAATSIATTSGVAASGQTVLASEPATISSEAPLVATPPAATSSNLPETGTDVYLTLFGAMFAITTGLALALGARRRRLRTGNESADR